MKLVLVAAVALIDADGRVLIAERPEGYEALRRGADVVSSDFSLPELVEVEQTVAAMEAYLKSIKS